MPARPPHRAAQLVQVIGFALVLLMPALDTVLRLDPTPAPAENRRLKSMPAAPGSVAAALAWPKGFDAWFFDHFGLRASLVETNARVRLQLLGVSPAPDKPVLVGRNGWLYYSGNAELDDLLRRKPFTPQKLDRFCSATEAQRTWLEARGIRFLFVVAPNKSTIYPEHLPRWIVTPDRPSRTDQVLEALRSRTAVEVLDLRGPLLEAKQREQVYSATDTHWNDFGGHVAYTEIMKRLQPWFPNAHPLPRTEYLEVSKRVRGQGLAGMLGAQRLLREDVVWLVAHRRPLVNPVNASDNRDIERNGDAMVFERADAEIGRLVLLGDSFLLGFRKYLSEHFGRSVYLWWQLGFPAAAIEKEHPDVVIVEEVERLLSWMGPSKAPPAAPPE